MGKARRGRGMRVPCKRHASLVGRGRGLKVPRPGTGEGAWNGTDRIPTMGAR